VTNGWTNEAAIGRWDAIPRAALDALEPDGGFAKRALLNPALLRLAGDLRGRRVLDAGCGTGYLSRMLAARGATVVGLEPAGELVRYAAGKPPPDGPPVHYLQADLCAPPGLAGAFDVVVSSMVLMAEPGLDPAVLDSAVTAAAGDDGARGYVHLPNFCVLLAERMRSGS